jgi:hypothetical protein
MIYYGHGRKIMYIPFPFVHAQLSAAFVLMMIPTIPFLMDQYTDDLWLGIVLSFCTTMCLSGIHEGTFGHFITTSPAFPFSIVM